MYILVLLLSLTHWCTCQTESTESRNLFYLEGGGFGGIGSLNFERITYTRGFFSLGPRIGFGFNRFKDFTNHFNPDITIPFGVLFTAGTNWRGEIGVGTTYSSVVHVGDELEPERVNEVHANLCIGARYQPTNGGLLLRAGYSPIIERFSYYRHWAYLAIGIVF